MAGIEAGESEEWVRRQFKKYTNSLLAAIEEILLNPNLLRAVCLFLEITFKLCFKKYFFSFRDNKLN